MAAAMKDVTSLASVAAGTVSNVLNSPGLVRPQQPPPRAHSDRRPCRGRRLLFMRVPFRRAAAAGAAAYGHPRASSGDPGGPAGTAGSMILAGFCC